MEYLGYVVSARGVAIDQQKVKAVLEWLALKSIKRLRDFLGLIGCYRKFIKYYGKIAKPLIYLLKKRAFRWSNEVE